jgi:hypothetical protein
MKYVSCAEHELDPRRTMRSKLDERSALRNARGARREPLTTAHAKSLAPARQPRRLEPLALGEFPTGQPR